MKSFLTITFLLLITISSAHPDPKKDIILKILNITMDKEQIQKQEKELLDRLVENIAKVNVVVRKDLFEWEKPGERLDKLNALFDQMEDKHLQNLREDVQKELNVPNLMRQIQARIYYKYYELDELKTLFKFYRTKAGRKTLKVGPLILQESQDAFQKVMIPKTTEISKTAQREFIQDFMKESMALQ